MDTQPSPTQPTAQPARRRLGPVRMVLLVAASVWGAGWSTFVAFGAPGGDWRGLLIAGAFCAAAVCPVLLAWRFPRIGGVVLLLVGLGLAQVVHSRAAMVGAAIPAMALGLGLLLTGVLGARRPRRRRRRNQA